MELILFENFLWNDAKDNRANLFYLFIYLLSTYYETKRLILKFLVPKNTKNL